MHHMIIMIISVRKFIGDGFSPVTIGVRWAEAVAHFSASYVFKWVVSVIAGALDMKNEKPAVEPCVPYVTDPAWKLDEARRKHANGARQA